MPRARTQYQSRRTSRRQTDWAFVFLSTSSTNIAGTTKTLLSSISSANLAGIAPATIVRTRGIVTVKSDQVAAREEYNGAMGLGFVNETARALGATGVPGPTTLAAWDGWFVHQFFHQMFELATGASIDCQGATSYVIDSKAMRKFTDDVGLVLVAENSGSNGFDISISLRLLVKAG